VSKNVGVIGAQLGDEAKGSITHALSSDFDWVCRFNGGNNCGATVYHKGTKIVHHLIPAIDFAHSKARAFLASGMVIDLDALLHEISTLKNDFPDVGSKITVDPDAFLVLAKHKEEDAAKNKSIGTTGRGIGPAYTDKVSRRGIRVRDYINDNSLIIDALKKYGVSFKTVLEMRHEFSNSRLLFEGAQGVLLDINHGTYPFVSCSDTTVSGIFSSGFSFAMPKTVYGVAKAYMTRVGEGPFPTEITGINAAELRALGKEYGATTGRARRIGWLDLPALKYAVDVSGITDLIITKMDVLNSYKNVPVCNRYANAPMSGADFSKAVCNMIDIKGWEDARKFDQIKEFIETIEYHTATKVAFISCGIKKTDILGLG
jgi:adenylosuccinate synthase